MGILDDAIREHLDLKRRLGAEEDELQRLEGEAFGPPTRPGRPRLPRQPTTGAQALVGDATGPRARSRRRPTSEEPRRRGARDRRGARRAARRTAAEGAAAGAASTRPRTSSTSTWTSTSTSPRRAGGVDPDAPAAEPPASGRAEPEAAPEPERAGPAEPAAPPPRAPVERRTAEPPIESLDTVEHPFEGAVEDTGEAELVEGELDEGSRRPAGEDEEDEDVLEETPEFLRDAPEDDELWFEQGEPKDFDF